MVPRSDRREKPAASGKADARLTGRPVEAAQLPRWPALHKSRITFRNSDDGSPGATRPMNFGRRIRRSADMTRWLRARTAPVVLVLGLVVLSPSVSARDDVILAKVGMEWLTKEQQQTLWHRVDQYAGMESFVSFCGRPSQIERRVVSAVQACITPATLQQVVSHFRKKLTEKKNGITADQAICEEQKMKNLVKQIHTAIDTMVAEVTRMCRNCLFC
jgi:hypothetical protein